MSGSVTSKSQTSEREDRSAVVATDDHLTALTTFSDTVNNQQPGNQRTGICKPHVASDPYPDSGLQEVLGRAYAVSNFLWAQTDTEDTLLTGAPITFPSALMNSTINSRLVHYKYFRAGVEVSIRLQSTTFHKGLLQVAWLPHWSTASKPLANRDPFASIYAESKLDNMIISANTQETVTFVIPYVAPSAYWDMISFNSESTGFFGFVSIRVLSQLSCGTNITPINVTVYARFLNPEVAGPIHYQMADLTGKVFEMKTFNDKSAVVDGQMPEGIRELDTEAKVRSQQSTQAEVAPAKKDSIGKTVMNVLGKIIGKFVDVVPRYVMAFAPLLLDQPTNVRAPEPVFLRTGQPWNFTRGLDNAIILASDPENKVATDHQNFNQIVDYNQFKNYLKLPSLLTTGFFNKGNTTGQVLFSYPVNPMYVKNEPGSDGVQYYEPTHLSAISSLFRAWRGGVKYRIYFVASHFVSARVRIEWLPDVVSTSTVTEEMMGNNINKVVDINGDTIVDFTIPFLQRQHWIVVSDYEYVRTHPSVGSNGMFRITLLNQIATAQSVAAADTINFVVWVSGDDTTQFAYPTIMSPADGEDGQYEVVQYQSKTESTYFSVRDVFSKPFEGLIGCRSTVISGYENGEEIQSFTEYLKRYTVDPNIGTTGTVITPSGNQPVDVWTNEAVVGIDYNNYGLITRNFYFQRGSKRNKVIWQPAPSAPVDLKLSVQSYAFNSHLIFDPFYQSGGYYQLMTNNPQMDVQTPFFYPYPFYAWTSFASELTPSPGFNITNYNTSGSASIKVLRSLGDDFTMAWPTGFGRLLFRPTA